MANIETKGPKGRILTGIRFMLGNNAIVEGALAAGYNFFAGYPITPANEIFERMSQRCLKSGEFLSKEKMSSVRSSPVRGHRSPAPRQ
jgi:TPP-dependent indolepyruvate ferredoxin oxidoreductase alpha subunit